MVPVYLSDQSQVEHLYINLTLPGSLSAATFLSDETFISLKKLLVYVVALKFKIGDVRYMVFLGRIL